MCKVYRIYENKDCKASFKVLTTKVQKFSFIFKSVHLHFLFENVFVLFGL